MRWIFFVLLVANILLFGWATVFMRDVKPPQASLPAPVPEETSVASITLLEDASQEESPAIQQVSEPEPLAAGLGGREPVEALCTFIGPFDDTARAEQLLERLSAMGVSGEVSRVDIPVGPGYWVYLEPLASRREALRRLAELQAQGVDSYVIPRGELANGISLGMFSRAPLAEAKMEEMTAMGIQAKLEVIERSYQEIWVSIPVIEAGRLGYQAWERLLEDQKNAELKQNFCLHVASQDNFH